MLKTLYVCDYCWWEVPQPHLDVPKLAVGVSKKNDFGQIIAPTIIQDNEHRHFCSVECFMRFLARHLSVAMKDNVATFYPAHPNIPGPAPRIF